MEYQVSVFLLERPLRTPFDYRLSLDNGQEPCVGARIVVPLGNSADNIGIIVKVSPLPSAAQSLKLKAGRLLDKEELLPPDIYNLCKFAADYYHYPQGQCFFTALPALLRAGNVAALSKSPGIMLTNAARNAPLPKIKSAQQLRLLQLLQADAHHPILRQELKDRGFNATCIRALMRRGLIYELDVAPALPQPWSEQQLPPLKEPGLTLNAEQQAAADAVIASLDTYETFLLYGITGSGKTEVYLHIIAAVVARGRSALVLVPEIALTPQTVERFYARFNVPVILMHSALSDKERLNAYLSCAQGHGAILIGTRSALFTPLPKLGLIVVDEEHDSSFKQGDGLRYHARTLAKRRAQLNHCPLVLGSATPAVETVYQTKCHTATLLQLTARAGVAQLPDLHLVDLRTEPLSEGLKTGIGRTLEDAIGLETAQGNQVLLFLNRRGYAHQLICHHCGAIMNCPHCDSPLTVHRAEGKLKCHICDTSFPIPHQCPYCGSNQLMDNGYGTEQVENFLKLRYPDEGIERIDRDSVKNKDDLENHLQRVRSGESSILIGTQMLAKGHDFPDVTLVGILDIDGGLFSDDFRAPEYTAQLLTQVAGRAGRAQKPGRVIIQTYHPDNLLLQQLIDPQLPYLSLVDDLLAHRASLHLPPYSIQAFLLTNSPVRLKAHRFLLDLLQLLQARKTEFNDLTLGNVMSDKIEKRHNRYHFHLQVLAPSRERLDAFLVATLQAVQLLKTDGVRFAIDVDPLSLY